MYQDNKTSPIDDADRTDTELRWKIQKVTEGETTEYVLTITGSDTALTFNSNVSWNATGNTVVPWADHYQTVTKVISEAPITTINQAYAFNKLCRTHLYL